MGWFTALFITYAVCRGFRVSFPPDRRMALGAKREFIVDGNHLTNLISIDVNTTADDEFTPGLIIHGNFEALDEALRINDSIARNPTLSFDTPRFLTAYVETAFPLAFLVSNQTANTTLNLALDDARRFFELHKCPEGFYRRNGIYDLPQISAMFTKVFDWLCCAYQKQVNMTAQMYPDPTPDLEAAIKANLTLGEPECRQLSHMGSEKDEVGATDEVTLWLILWTNMMVGKSRAAAHEDGPEPTLTTTSQT
ncbi:hypothetical protein OG21DRAFT_1519327 [Imleria badia]|nr:hypothetical protein OG21DRAFT_1519327 [Imleria badia]